MKLGLQVRNFTWESGPAQLGPTLAEIARTADDVGFEFITVMGHFWQIRNVGAPELDMLECYTTLGFLAVHSQRAKLLGMVTGNPYRHPGVLAKTVTSDARKRAATTTQSSRPVSTGLMSARMDPGRVNSSRRYAGLRPWEFRASSAPWSTSIGLRHWKSSGAKSFRQSPTPR